MQPIWLYNENQVSWYSRYHGLLIYDIERTTKIDGMGPFKAPENNDVSCMINDFELV